MKQTHTVTYETISAGQPRAYADSVYEFNMVFSAARNDGGYSDVWTPDRANALRYAKVHQDFYENPEWHQPKLEIFEETEKGKWHVKIVQPYLD